MTSVHILYWGLVSDLLTLVSVRTAGATYQLVQFNSKVAKYQLVANSKGLWCDLLCVNVYLLCKCFHCWTICICTVVNWWTVFAHTVLLWWRDFLTLTGWCWSGSLEAGFNNELWTCVTVLQCTSVTVLQCTSVTVLQCYSVTMSPQPVTMSPPLSFSILQQGEKCQKSAPSLPTFAQNISLHHFHGVQFNGVLKALSQGLTRPSRNQPGYQILAFHLSILCKYRRCETQQWFSEALWRLALPV